MKQRVFELPQSAIHKSRTVLTGNERTKKFCIVDMDRDDRIYKASKVDEIARLGVPL